MQALPARPVLWSGAWTFLQDHRRMCVLSHQIFKFFLEFLDFGQNRWVSWSDPVRLTQMLAGAKLEWLEARAMWWAREKWWRQVVSGLDNSRINGNGSLVAFADLGLRVVSSLYRCDTEVWNCCLVLGLTWGLAVGRRSDDRHGTWGPPSNLYMKHSPLRKRRRKRL